MTVKTTENQNYSEKEETKNVGVLFPISENNALNTFAKSSPFKKGEILREGAKLFMALQKSLTSESILSYNEIVAKIADETSLDRVDAIEQITNLQKELNRNASRIISQGEASITFAESLSLSIRTSFPIEISKIVQDKQGMQQTPYTTIVTYLKELLPVLDTCVSQNSCEKCPMAGDCDDLTQIIHSFSNYYDQIIEYKDMSLEELITANVPIERITPILRSLIPVTKKEKENELEQ